MRRFVLICLAALACAAPSFADDFVPGRPGATESAISVPQGRWQIETEIARVTHDDRDSAEARAWSAAATSFRYGVARGADVELIIEPYQRVTIESGGAEESAEGFGDITLRARRTFVGQDGGASFGLIGYVALPTAEDDLGAADVEGGVLAAGAFDVADRWSIAWTAGLGALSAGEDDYEAAGSLGATLGYAFTDRWGGYVETFAARAESDDETAVSINLGTTFLARADMQFDAGAEFGVAGGADDVSLFIGWARLF